MPFLYTLKVPKEWEEEIILFLYERIPKGWEWEEDQDFTYFRLYLGKDEEEVLKELLTFYKTCELKVEDLKEEDWVNSWKNNFNPLKVGKKLLILPPWEERSPSLKEIPIYIEPAQAFGTGYHPTTQLMLENIELFFEKLSNNHFLEVMDFGCGTGILGIACAKLYDNIKIYALDIDELALEATSKNINLNKVASKFVLLKQLPLEKKFDLILANLNFQELKKEALNILKISKKGITRVFISGLLIDDFQEIKDMYQKLDFICEKIEKKEEWIFLEFFYA